MRMATTAVFFIFGIILSGAISDAADYSYDKFYKADAAFKKSDERLNSIYRELQGLLEWGARNSLLAEQRYWHDRLFPLLAEYADTDGKAGDAARKVLERRILELEKLKSSAALDGILGMDITFGMIMQKVAEKLGIRAV